jgi:hypothetical protein
MGVKSVSTQKDLVRRLEHHSGNCFKAVFNKKNRRKDNKIYLHKTKRVNK